MSRKSAASLSVIPAIDARATRLQPRADMAPTLKQIFADLVASMPPEHFRRGDVDLLEQFAAQVKLARQAYDEIEASGPVINNKPNAWIVVLEKANRACVQLGVRLRIGPMSRIDPKTVARKQEHVSYYDLMRQDRDDDGAA
jgi:hypothetical protein